MPSRRVMCGPTSGADRVRGPAPRRPLPIARRWRAAGQGRTDPGTPLATLPEQPPEMRRRDRRAEEKRSRLPLDALSRLRPWGRDLSLRSLAQVIEINSISKVSRELAGMPLRAVEP